MRQPLTYKRAMRVRGVPDAVDNVSGKFLELRGEWSGGEEVITRAQYGAKMFASLFQIGDAAFIKPKWKRGFHITPIIPNRGSKEEVVIISACTLRNTLNLKARLTSVRSRK